MKSKIFLLFFLFSLPLFSQEETAPVTETVIIDSTWEDRYYSTPEVDSILHYNPETSNTVYPKKFAPEFREKYKGEEFDYTTIKPRESLWEKIGRKIQEMIEAVFGKMNPAKANSVTETIIRLLAIIIIGFILYFVIRYVVGKDGNFFFSKKNKKVNIATGDLAENIHEINFPESILQFEKQKDYRSAIRYHFLFILKKLSDKKLIEWNPEKTNRDYLYELKAEKSKEKYQKLSYIFDHVWYGEFEISENDYEYFKNQFLTSEL